MSFCFSRSIGASRKDVMETMVARKREKELCDLNQWKSHAAYLNNSALRAERERLWTSTQSKDSSLQAFETQNYAGESEECIEDRRQKLRSLLDEEVNKQKNLLNEEKSDLSMFPDKDTGLGRAGELSSNQLVNKLSSFNLSNNGELKPESSDTKPQVRSSTGEIPENLNQQKALPIDSHSQTRNDRQNVFNVNASSEENIRARQVDTRGDAENLEQHQKKLRFLQDQFDELHFREREAERLVEEENELERMLVKLDKLELELRSLDERHKRGGSERVPLRQHLATLRRRSVAIQAELNEQLEWLKCLQSLYTSEKRFNDQERYALDGTKAVRQILEADLEKERKFELELDILMGHEAASLWPNKESTWIRESNARQKLLFQLLDEHRQNAMVQLQVIRHKQREELQSREALLEAVEQLRCEEVPDSMTEKTQFPRNNPVPKDTEDFSTQREQTAKNLAASEAEKAYEAILRKETDNKKLSEIPNSHTAQKRSGTLSYNYYKPGGNIW